MTNIKPAKKTYSISQPKKTYRIVERNSTVNVNTGRRGLKGDPGKIQELIAGPGIIIDSTNENEPIITAIGAGGVSQWGYIGGTLSDQTDLQNALNAKADTSSLGSAAYGDVVQGLGVSTADVISQDAFTTILGQTVLSVNNILLNKVDKVTGKGLSTNDYTDTDRDKLANLVSDKTYVQDFTMQYNLNINHNLQKYPSVTVLNSAGDKVESTVEYLDMNNVVLEFTAPFSGRVTLN